MSTNLIKIDIRDYGFLDFGAAKVESVEGPHRKQFEKYLAEGCNAGMGYLARNLDKRFDPSLLVPGAASVLCFLAPYGRGEGGVAGFAQGIDYHKVVKDRLFSVIDFLKESFPGFEGRPFVDSAPVLERFWAVKAGLGFIGQNNFFISPEYGLRTIIGVIISNIPVDRFPPHGPLPVEECGSCGACLRACPSGALRAPFDIDARKCISYHTVESHDALPDYLNPDGSLFGCDRCLEACPWNREIPAWPEFRSHHDQLETMTREDWKRLDEASFDESFGTSSLTRAGLDKIKDNAR